MTLKFKIEDFKYYKHRDLHTHYLQHELMESWTQLAQKVFDEWLEKHRPVYGDNTWAWYRDNLHNYSHKARVVAIEEIKKEPEPCKHEAGPMKSFSFRSFAVYECIHCRKKLKSTGWEEIY